MQVKRDADRTDEPAIRYGGSKYFPYPCRLIFALVADIERYPEFLPGWSRVVIRLASETRLEVDQQLRIDPVPVHFRSVAQLERCRRIVVTSVDAPFGDMTIDWLFSRCTDSGCDVRLKIELVLRAGVLRSPLQQMMGYGCEELLQRFENRAQSLFGASTPSR